MSAALASWSGYLTWYAFNVNVQYGAQVMDTKNPLRDSTGKSAAEGGSPTVMDFVMYMHADNMAGGGGATVLGMPYTVLLDSTDPTAPVLRNDSEGDLDPSGGPATMAAGGKLTYVIANGTCFNVDETIQFDAKFERVE
jgi:hypothetical protein